MSVTFFSPAALFAAGLPVVSLCIGEAGTPVRAEVAATPEQRHQGLMGRRHLPADAGMVFRFDPPAPAGQGFYMYRTLIPLDIAFIDEGRIVAIQTMAPCISRHAFLCPIYAPGQPYQQALEVNAGFFERHGIHPGDRIGPC